MLNFSFGSKKHQSGFSLVELMVALVIGLIITLGAFQLFSVSKRNFDYAASVMSRQEALRYLYDSLSYDIRSAESLGVLSSDNAQLSLSFNKSNTYCTSADRYRLEYRQPDEESAIYLDVYCDGVAGISESIVLGVGEVGFLYTQPATVSSGAYSTIPVGPVGIVVNVKMVDETGMLEDEIYTFRVANRASIGKSLEKRVGP